MRISSRPISSPNLILVILCLGIFSTAIDQTVIYGAMKDIMFDVHLNVFDLDAASWIVTGYLLGYTAVLLLAGRLSDVYGPRHIFILGNLVFMAASVFIAVVDDFSLMIAARVLQAIGGGATVPAAMAIVADAFPGKGRPIAFGIVGGSVELGAAIGPTFGGAVTEFLGWRWIFWIDVIIGAAVVLLIYFMIRNKAGLRYRIDYLSGLYIALALAFMSLGLSQQLHRPNAEVYLAGYLVGSALFLYLFIRRMIKAEKPLIHLSMFREITFFSANATHLLVGGALIIALVVVPVMAYTPPVELSDVGVGLRLGRLTFMIPIGAVIGGLLCHRFGYRIPTFLGLIMSGAGFFLMSRWTLEIADPWLTAHLVLCGFGLGLVIAPIATAVLNSVAQADWGIASAIVTATRMTGMIIGLAFMNSIGMGHFHVAAGDIASKDIEEALPPLALGIFQDLFFAAGIVCLIAIVLAFWMKPHQEAPSG